MRPSSLCSFSRCDSNCDRQVECMCNTLNDMTFSSSIGDIRKDNIGEEGLFQIWWHLLYFTLLPLILLSFVEMRSQFLQASNLI